MGYYSSVNRVTFESALTEAEMKKVFEKYVCESASKADYLEDYEFCCDSEKKEGLYEYALEMGHYFAKHYAHSELALFISKVITPGKHSFIEFVGEDEERWGYLVLSNEVHDLTYETRINGKTLSEFLSSKTAGCEGNSRRDDVKDVIAEALRNKSFDKSTSSIYELAAEIADEVFAVLGVSEEEQDKA